MTDLPFKSAPNLSDALLEEGAIWFARMRGPDAEDFRSEFEKWLADGALHKAAYERAGEIFAAGRFLASERSSSAVVANDNIRSTGRSLKWLAAAAIVGLGIVIIPMVIRQQATGPFGGAAVDNDARHITQVIEHRSYVGASYTARPIRLSDGSLVTLKPGSVLTQVFGAGRRELHLEKGDARFEVAHDERPFVVLAGGGSVTARGTIFDVRFDESRQVIVDLLRGSVDVERPRQSDGSSAPFSRLTPGETLAFRASGGHANRKVPGDDAPFAANAIDYSRPREFDRTPVAAVLAETQAASGITIHFANPDAEQMRVSGRFRVDDGHRVAERLAALFGLKIEQSSESHVTLRQEN